MYKGETCRLGTGEGKDFQEGKGGHSFILINVGIEERAQFFLKKGGDLILKGEEKKTGGGRRKTSANNRKMRD